MPPTLLDLRTRVARDLRDPGMTTFTSSHVDDLINAGLNELGAIRPREVIQTITPVAATYAYATTLSDIWRVEVWRSGVYHAVLDAGDNDLSATGWDIYAGQIHFPKAMIDAAVPATDSIKVWGYAAYTSLTTDGQVSEVDDMGEWVVRRYARATAFELMHADRALFAQWQAQSNNTDTTNNQLSQMVALYRAEWERIRGTARRLRRT